MLAYGFAYVDGGDASRPASSRARRALFSVTTGGTPERFSPEGVYGEIGQVLLSGGAAAAPGMGYEVLPPFVSYVLRVADAEREAYLRAWADTVTAAVGTPVRRTELDAQASLSGVGAAAWGRKV